MPVSLKGNFIFVGPNSRRYEVSSNFTNYLELGIQGVTEYYLEAKIEDEEFKISGTLLNENGDTLCHLNENFITSAQGCNKEMTPQGYRIKDQNDNLVFEIQVEEDQAICHLKSTIYGESGEVIAQDREGDFIILKGPAIIGKSGNAIGIKLD